MPNHAQVLLTPMPGIALGTIVSFVEEIHGAAIEQIAWSVGNLLAGRLLGPVHPGRTALRGGSRLYRSESGEAGL